MTDRPDIVPALYAPGDLVPIPLDLETLLLTPQAPHMAPALREELGAAMRAQYAVHPQLPTIVYVQMPKSIEVQRILTEKQFAEEALDAKVYDMEPEVYAEKKAAILERFQQRMLAWVQPLPAGCPWHTADELPIAIINYLWEQILYLGSGLTQREVQGSTGRSGSGSPGSETTTASARVVAVPGDTIRKRTKKA